MKTVVGFDEAGYGPTLGPLVVGLAAFRLESAPGDLFQHLRGVVQPRPTRSPSHLGITDSKRLYGGGRSLRPLELPVLAFRTDCPVPGPLEGMLPEAFRTDLPDWYQRPDERPEVPVAVRSEAVEDWRQRLGTHLTSRGIEEVHCRVDPVHEPRFNRLVGETGNKAKALMAVLLPLIRDVTERYPEDDMEVHVDRLGGRRYYQGFLGAVFPQRTVRTLREGVGCSEYQVLDGARIIQVSFETGGDATHLPVALASMAAKYTREVLLRRFNNHFRRRLPGLRPTAGYPQDARRFLHELEPHLEPQERARMVRCC